MTSVRNAVATLLVCVACTVGLAACGGGDDKTKISDAAFVTECTKELADDARLKAYGSDICTCVQEALEAKDLGDETTDSNKAEEEATAVTPQCTRDALGQS